EIRARLLVAIDEAQARHRAQQRAVDQVVADLNRYITQLLAQVTGQMRAGLDGLAASMSSLQAASRAQTKAAVKAARQTVDALVIKAPFSGVVTLAGPSAGGTAHLGGLGSLDGLAGLAGAAAGDLGGLRLPAPGSGRSGGVIATGVPVGAGDPILTVTDVSRLT